MLRGKGGQRVQGREVDVVVLVVCRSGPEIERPALPQQRSINKFARGHRHCPKSLLARNVVTAPNEAPKKAQMMSLVDYSSSEDDEDDETVVKVPNETVGTSTSKLPSLPSGFHDLYSGTCFLLLD
jgi:hypothetical protein